MDFGDATDPAIAQLIIAAIYINHLSVWIRYYRFRIFLI